jgi:hypothetical protein
VIPHPGATYTEAAMPRIFETLVRSVYESGGTYTAYAYQTNRRLQISEGRGINKKLGHTCDDFANH